MPYRHLHIVLLLLLVLTSAACSHPVDSRLLDAESLIGRNPDSALVALHAIDRTAMSRSDSMFATLLEVKAADKAYITASSDSAIQSLLRYYIDGNREKRLHPIVLYYAGRTYYDLGKIDLALRYFKRAADKAEKDGDPDLLASIHSQTAGLYFDNHLCRHALKHGKLWLKYCRMLPDSSEAFNAALSVAFKYRKLALNDSAAPIYRRLALQADTLSDRMAASQFYTQFASFLMGEGRFSEADSIISSHHITWKKESGSAILAILNKIDTKKGDSTQIVKRNRELLNSPDMQPRQQASKSLAHIFLKKGLIDSAFYYTDLYASITDSILDRQATMPLAEVEAFISDSENEIALLSKENEIQSRNIIILIVCALAAVGVAAFIIFIFRSRLRIAHKELENRKLKEETEENKKTIERYAVEIEKLTEKLHSIQYQNKADSEAKLLEAQIGLKNTATRILEHHLSLTPKQKREILENLERIFSITDAGFITNLRKLNLQKRDFEDALLIKIDIPQNICANLLDISPTGLANARSRQLKKMGLDKNFKNWAEFIRSL